MACRLKTFNGQFTPVSARRLLLASAKHYFRQLRSDYIEEYGVDNCWFDDPYNFRDFYVFYKDTVNYFQNGLTGYKPTFSFPIPEIISVPKRKALSDLSPKDKIWEKHRANSDLIRDSYKRTGYDRYAERIDRCAAFLDFGRVIDDKQFLIKLVNTHFCRHRHCLICQWRKALKWSARFYEAMPKISRDYPTHRYIFLTLTVKNCLVTDLRNTIDLMNKAWKRLTELKVFPADGFIKSFEVTRSFDSWDGSKFIGTHGKTFVSKWEKENKRKLRLVDTNYAHPHFHILMMVPSGYFTTKGGYLSHERWMDLWRKCLRVDYDPVVNIKAIKPKSPNATFDALKEALKYSLKPEDLVVDPKKLTPAQVIDRDNWLVELTNQLHKTKAVSLGGIFKKYLSETEPDDLINIDEEKDGLKIGDEILRFDWYRHFKQYIQRSDVE